MTTPPFDVVEAIESGESRITRRIEIFEQDGETPWYPAADELVIERFVDGGVNIDGNRAERRTFDCTLYNSDQLLRPNPRNGFWYDKVIKMFRGVNYVVPQNRPRITIMEQPGDNNLAFKFLAQLKNMGYTRSDVNLVTTDIGVYDQADILISYRGTTPSQKSDILKRHFDNGKSVLTIGTGNTGAEVPHLTAGAATSSAIQWGATPVSTDTPVAGHWTAGSTPDPSTGYAVSGVSETAVAVALWINGTSPAMITASLVQNNAGGRWFDFHLPSIDNANLLGLINAAIQWLQHYTPMGQWETQVGEFVIDGMNDRRFPGQIKVTGRDYAKRCIISKIPRDVIFPTGTSISELIRALARNSQITGNMNVPEIGKYLTAPLAYAAKTPRWDIMVAAANGVGYQLYFNNVGELTMVPYNDPVYDPVAYEFKTGADGNLVDYERSTNDSNLFNHIVVYGAANAVGIPYFGEALNTDPNSPTSINEIGDRYYEYSFDTVTSDNDAVRLAGVFLKVAALETYELNFSSICYPWAEANTISRIKDPNAFEWEPDKYLTDTVDIPMGLGPMGMTGKRITHVGEPN